MDERPTDVHPEHQHPGTDQDIRSTAPIAAASPRAAGDQLAERGRRMMTMICQECWGDRRDWSGARCIECDGTGLAPEPCEYTDLDSHEYWSDHLASLVVIGHETAANDDGEGPETDVPW